MVTTTMEPETEIATDLRGGESLVEQFTSVVGDPARRHAADGMLRALTRPLLGALTTMRHEAIEPYEQGLGYASQRLAADLDEDGVSITEDPRYLLGRVEALLDICDMGIDRSISTATLRQAAERKHVFQILAHLVDAEETRASTLAEAVGISRQQLSNLLAWMEATDLVRRAAAGRATLVSLGPKGEAVHRTLSEALLLQARPAREQRTTAPITHAHQKKAELRVFHPPFSPPRVPRRVAAQHMSPMLQAIGRVVSDNQDKSVVVAVHNVRNHPLSAKRITRTSKLMAYDEHEAAKPGDLVRIEGTRPVSRHKPWTVREVLKTKS